WEQIASLGGRPLELDFIPDAEAEGGYARPLTEEENEQVREALADNVTKQDVVITTAQIPGRPAPLLLTDAAVRGMQPGSVIVAGACITHEVQIRNERAADVAGQAPAPSTQHPAPNQ